jgi:glycerol-3-phosphate dehydrogenase
MNRREMIEWCKRSPDIWDIIIIGGGATGLGAAIDAASRGFKTLLLERADFASGTSSRSTKLIHGGLRYLKQGKIDLVMEGLKERGLLCENAPHLVRHLGFVIPRTKWWEGPFYGIGMKVYDLLAGSLRIESSHIISKAETERALPTLAVQDLKGGILYYDGQFDDARLAIALAQTADDKGAVLLNYMPVTKLIKENGKVIGVQATDLETSEQYQLQGKVIINATGPFSDEIRTLDDSEAEPMIAPSQGIHLILDKSFFPANYALLVPKTSDGRLLFFVPWEDRLLLGTTDTPIDQIPIEPKPQAAEIDFLLKAAANYLTKKPKRSDILSIFTGIRPLVKTGSGASTASLSRNHVIKVSESGVITIAGGKWTTYRRMGQEVIDKAIAISDLDEKPCQTQNLKIHGYQLNSPSHYGTDEGLLDLLATEHPQWNKPLHPNLKIRAVEVIWAVRVEMARTVEDVLSRRTRSLLMNAKAARDIALDVAHIMAVEMGHGPSWERDQIAHFMALSESYLP